MAHGDFKNLTRRTVSDKILRDKAFNIAKNLKYNGYQRELALVVHQFLDKKTSGGTVKSENISNKELVKKYTHQFLANLRKEKYTQVL